ncbi:MAG: cation-translocating P-type ATPase, partial [Alcanivoracaceae bacterium]|nr:cation-translocating P-type ATPase [Alcanivoracaceae bacterium]
SAVRDAVALLIGGNLGEIGFTLLAGLLDGRSPLNARQLLLVNLLTDTIPALAVALRRPDESARGVILHDGPDASLGDALTRDIEWRAALTTSVTTLFWALNRARGQNPSLSTLSMLILVGTQLAQTVLAGKGSRDVILSSLLALIVMGVIVQTPGLSHLFGCRPLGPRDWAQVVASMLLSLAASSALPWAEQNVTQLINRARKEIQDLLEQDPLDA